MAKKPRVLVDIKTPRLRIFKDRPLQVNLFKHKTLRLPIFSVLKILVLLSAASSMIFGSVLAPINHSQLLAAQNDDERQALENQLADLESQIAQYENTIESYKKQGSTLQAEINRLNAEINKINLQIKAVNLSLSKLSDEIVENNGKIKDIEYNISLNKDAITKSIQNIYENDDLSLLAILIKNSSLSEFFGDINSWFEVQDSLTVTLERIINLRSELLDEKEILALKKSDVESLKTYQDAQRKNLANIKLEKSDVLEETKGQESKYQSLLKEKQKTAAQIRSQIFQLLGGGELSFEKAYELAKFSEQATGVRAAMILAVLDRESALGQNVGKCDYQTAMHPTRDLPVFLKIVADLKQSGKAPPEPIKVSCPIRSDGAYGGAMGPAQFIPSTWGMYAARIVSVTGSSPANPWSNADAFVATGLYLKDAYNSQACIDYSKIIPSDARTLRERCAAAKYYAGSRWYTYRWAYGEPVVKRANQFQEDIDILNS
ncbi:MAG: lytic murein transglycosylase [bacterium]|nr:lytic murein transglycosylase [bacterium]